MTLEEAQMSDHRHAELMQNYSPMVAVDRWFADRLRDCRARRKAAILRASRLVGA